MKRVLLDECLPRQLKTFFPDVSSVTVRKAGFSGFTNGKLLTAISGKFDVFLTIDGNLEHQQGTSGLDFGIVVITAKSNRIEQLTPFTKEIADAIASVEMGHVVHVGSK